MLAFIYFECFILDSFNVLIPSVFCMHKIHTCSYHQPVQYVYHTQLHVLHV